MVQKKLFGCFGGYFMIYFFDDLEGLPLELQLRALKIMPKDRREKALSYHHEIDCKLCVVGYLLLIFGIYKEYGILIQPEFEYLNKGKPILKDYPHIHFNISHCRKGVVCILNDMPVGIDIQEELCFDYDFASTVCNSTEMERVLDSCDNNMEFSKLWTAKESVVKLSGEGITQNLKILDISEVECYRYKSVIISVAKNKK